jgi:exodeoxyribonuclease X
MSKKQAIIIDTETHSKDNLIPIEIAWFNPVTNKSFNRRYNPVVPITLGALSVHHILDEELIDCPSPDTFKIPDDVGYFIAHNAKFDYEALGSPAHIKCICTLALARKYLPFLDSHSQSALTYYFFRNEAKEMLKQAHSALADVMNLHKLLIRMRELEIWPKCKNWHDMYLLSEDAKTPTHWTFGKFKGKPLNVADKGYVDWYLKLPVNETDKYLVKSLMNL